MVHRHSQLFQVYVTAVIVLAAQLLIILGKRPN